MIFRLKWGKNKVLNCRNCVTSFRTCLDFILKNTIIFHEYSVIKKITYEGYRIAWLLPGMLHLYNPKIEENITFTL